ncbi:hypothetical protein C1H46_011654 [Malus baccata]|uniref:Uncharacterized protein n=1 Tax=Malus baccata TaxID=106549 RepID=A0A540MWM3_MALBA|nr:hypothetical protein C1H46_011654 [Malus baccata]
MGRSRIGGQPHRESDWQAGRERGGNGLPKKLAPGRGQHRMKGMAFSERGSLLQALHNLYKVLLAFSQPLVAYVVVGIPTRSSLPSSKGHLWMLS